MRESEKDGSDPEWKKADEKKKKPSFTKTGKSREGKSLISLHKGIEAGFGGGGGARKSSGRSAPCGRRKEDRKKLTSKPGWNREGRLRMEKRGEETWTIRGSVLQKECGLKKKRRAGPNENNMWGKLRKPGYGEC